MEEKAELEANKSAWIGQEQKIPSLCAICKCAHSEWFLEHFMRPGLAQLQVRWLLKACYQFRAVGQIIFSVKAEKYRLASSYQIKPTQQGWEWAGGSESSPQTPASHSDSEAPLLLGRGCGNPAGPAQVGSEGQVILEKKGHFERMSETKATSSL